MDVRTILQVVFLLIFFAGSTLAKENVPCSDGLDIYIDESANDCLQNITKEALEGLNQTNALKLAPNRWRNPTLKLNCSGRTRRDFSEFSTLEFYFRSPNPDPGAPLLHLETWNNKSAVVPIRDYIPGGIIDNTFRLVRIPLSVLATSQWDLGNVERLVWSNDPDSKTYYVDNIRLRQTEPLELVSEGQYAPFPETDTVLRLTFSKRYQEETVRNPKNYYLRSLSDPSYSDPVHPIEAGLKYRVERFSPSGIPAVRFSVFVKFPYPLKNGCWYRLMVDGVSDTFCNIMKPTEVEINYDDTSLLNENIKVNQVGYLPDAPKVGYVGGYSGDLGGTTWAVGDDGAVISLKARTQPKRLESNVKNVLRGVSGIREDSIYCVGDRGVILNWNGADFNRVDSLTDEDLLGVHFGPTGIGWAVGKGGITLRCQNGHWTRIPTPIKTTLRGVWAGPGDTAWAVGDSGTIIRWDGKSWISEDNPVRSDLHAVHGCDADQIWAVGNSGVVLLRKSKHWSQVPGFPQTSANLLLVITDHGGGVWIGGDQGLVWSKSDSGASEFVAQTDTTDPICGLTRQDSLSLLALGSNGQLLSFVSPTAGWKRFGFLKSEN